ncbi:MAG: hypothetical protein ACWA41_08355 [Putridiphycobacter sp.]
MKIKTIIATFLIGLILTSCGSSSSKQPHNAEGFSAIESDLKSQFGDNAYYTDITISYDASIGNIISVTETDKPESLTMREWNNMQGGWQQTADVSIEIPEGTKAADFMFQLNDDINLKTLGDLVEKSIADLKETKNIAEPVLDNALINFPDNGDMSKAQYAVMLEPKNGGTTFYYYYNLNGELDRKDF